MSGQPRNGFSQVGSEDRWDGGSVDVTRVLHRSSDGADELLGAVLDVGTDMLPPPVRHRFRQHRLIALFALLVLGIAVAASMPFKMATMWALLPSPPFLAHIAFGTQAMCSLGGLQQHDTLYALSSTPAQRQRLASALPIVWVHVPKCGSSFHNTLIHNAGVCPQWPSCASLLPGDSDHAFFKRFPRAIWCPDGFASDYPSPPGHNSAAEALQHHGSGRGVIFLRQPEERLASAYASRWNVRAGESMAAYASRAHGCSVKMLARQSSGRENCLEAPHPSDAEVALAIERLWGFAFVGLTEEWGASICLFHAMFGGRCHEAEELNTRPTIASSRTQAESMLGNKSIGVDPYDGALHEVAKEIFYAGLRNFRIEPGMPCQYCTASVL